MRLLDALKTGGEGPSSLARLGVTAFATCAIVNTIFVIGSIASGSPPGKALTGTVYQTSRDFLHPPDVDSWWPMAVAYQRIEDRPDGDVYDVFRVDRIKFQYPPTSLLVMHLFPAADVAELAADESGATANGGDNAIRAWVAPSARIAVLLTILFGALMVLQPRDARPSGTGPSVPRWFTTATVFALGLTYYPLLQGSVLGQVQVFLGMLVCASLWLTSRQRDALAGACACLACSIKPQYGLLLVWALLLSRWRFASGFTIAGVLILVLSIFSFGWDNHLSYLGVMGELSRSGESFWPNQSTNGLLQRLLENGSPMAFERHGFPPFHPTVYYVTLATSAALVGLALYAAYRARTHGQPVVSMALALMASTMASPIAWEHHYGSFFAVFCAASGPIAAARPWGRWSLPLVLVSYALMANVNKPQEALFSNPWTGLLASHLFFGALLLFGQLATLLLRRGASDHARPM